MRINARKICTKTWLTGIRNIITLPISSAISFLAATKSSYCLRCPSSICLQCANDKSCFGNCEAKALVRQALHAAAPVAPPSVGARSANDDQ